MKTREDYQLYLKSDHWRKLRGQVVGRDRKCVRCGSRHRLQAHHKFYRETWELSIPDDLITLCRPCHEKEHGLPISAPIISTWHELQSAYAKGLISRTRFMAEQARFPRPAPPIRKKAPRRFRGGKKHKRKIPQPIQPLPVLYYRPPVPKWTSQRGSSSN